jgi:hypothetical protein
MNFYIGQTFDKPAPPEAAEWCNKNNAHIEKINSVRIIVENPHSPEPTPEEILKEYEDIVQAFLDKTAQSKGYDNTYTCLSYLSSTNKTWKTESNIFNGWRDQVWEKCHEILNSVIANEITQPTIDELIEQLPKIEW